MHPGAIPAGVHIDRLKQAGHAKLFEGKDWEGKALKRRNERERGVVAEV
jgi:hypothetical protein